MLSKLSSVCISDEESDERCRKAMTDGVSGVIAEM